MKTLILHFPFVGQDGDHTCRVEFDWLGHERYFVDDKAVLQRWSLRGGEARFSTHGVQLRILSEVVKGHAVTQVSLDGKVIVPNLLEEFNRETSKRLGSRSRGGLGRWLSKVGIWAVISFTLFSLLKWVERHVA